MPIIEYVKCFRDAAVWLMRAERRPVIVLAVAGLLSLPGMPAELWLVKTVVDRIQRWTAGESLRPIAEAAVWLAGWMAVRNIALGVPVPMAQTRLNEIGPLEGQRLILQKTGVLPLAAVEAPYVQQLRERAQQLSLHETYATGVQLLQNALHAAALLAILLAYGQWLPVAAIGLSALLLALATGRAAADLERLGRRQTADRRLLAYYASLLTRRETAKEIRLFGLGELLSARWQNGYERQAGETVRAVWAGELVKLGPALLTALTGGLLAAALALSPGANQLGAGDFTLLLLSATLLVSLIPQLIGNMAVLRRQRMRWDDFRAYLALEEHGNGDKGEAAAVQPASQRASFPGGDLEHDKVSRIGASPQSERTDVFPQREPADTTLQSERIVAPPQTEPAGASPQAERAAKGGAGELRVRDLRFRYPGAERDTIDGISLTVPAGCRAALVGENGSGKSTLVKLLSGLYAPSGGEIVWLPGGGGPPCSALRPADKSPGGIPLLSVAFPPIRPSEASSRATMSAVFQDFARLNITLRENVALGRLSALGDDSALRGALRLTGSRLRELDAQIGAAFGGIEPSGGEWQKVVTARALLRDAAFVLYDEPTSALDPLAEKDAFELFLRATAGRSVLLVTHRLGAARLADRIFVLKAGRIAEQGSHDELMALGGEYSRMFRLQSFWYA